MCGLIPRCAPAGGLRKHRELLIQQCPDRSRALAGRSFVGNPSAQNPAGDASPQVFKASQARDGIFTLRLTFKDDLAADNQASIVSLLPSR